MNILLFLSDAMIPILIFSIVGYGLINHHSIYDDFIKGATDGFHTVIGIMPTLIGLMVGVGILRASGFLDLLSSMLGVITEPLHFPAELVPVSIVKMFSSSAATGLVLDIFKQYGPDSLYGTSRSSFHNLDRDNCQRYFSHISRSYKFCFARYCFVSATITLLNNTIAIRLGTAINPLKISAIVHTAETVINGPINTQIMYNRRYAFITCRLPPVRYSRHFSL